MICLWIRFDSSRGTNCYSHGSARYPVRVKSNHFKLIKQNNTFLSLSYSYQALF